MTDGKISPLSGGASQSELRAHNERLLLSILHRHGPMPGSDLARQTGLSPQTVSVILRRLQADGLVARGEPVAGKVGKPFVPVRLEPDGVLSFGLKIGRRSAELLLMNMTGAVKAHRQVRYDYPLPEAVFGFLEDGLQQCLDGLVPDQVARVCGLGIAAPFDLWQWHDLVGAPAQAFAAWRDVDYTARVSAFTDLPVHVSNDATAACRAEHLFGRGKAYRDYAYVFLGTFVGGGVVLDHAVFEGRTGNAGAFGSMPAGAAEGQLIDTASIHVLERRIADAGGDPRQLWRTPEDWGPFEAQVGPWLEQTAMELARSCLAACSVIDFEAVILDGALPGAVRERLVGLVRVRLADLDSRGVSLPQIVAGSIGGRARAVGAACAPIMSRFLIER